MHHSQKGFTLVETLVAITVLLLVIIGPMTVAQKGIQNAYYANDQVTAVFLAQEAIEAIRQLRDEDALDGGGTWNWYSELVDATSCETSSGCAFNISTGSFGACSGTPLCVLRFDTTANEYTHEVTGTSAPSPFTRKVFVGTPSVEGVPVTVDVTWTAKIFGGSTRTVKLQTWIYDQYQ